MIPESPLIRSEYNSPDFRRPEATSSRAVPPGPRFLSNPTPNTVLKMLEEARRGEASKGKGNDLRTRLILRHAMKWGIERGDLDLIACLTELTGDWVRCNLASDLSLRLCCLHFSRRAEHNR